MTKDSAFEKGSVIRPNMREDETETEVQRW